MKLALVGGAWIHWRPWWLLALWCCSGENGALGKADRCSRMQFLKKSARWSRSLPGNWPVALLWKLVARRLASANWRVVSKACPWTAFDYMLCLLQGRDSSFVWMFVFYRWYRQLNCVLHFISSKYVCKLFVSCCLLNLPRFHWWLVQNLCIFTALFGRCIFINILLSHTNESQEQLNKSAITDSFSYSSMQWERTDTGYRPTGYWVGLCVK